MMGEKSMREKRFEYLDKYYAHLLPLLKLVRDDSNLTEDQKGAMRTNIHNMEHIIFNSELIVN